MKEPLIKKHLSLSFTDNLVDKSFFALTEFVLLILHILLTTLTTSSVDLRM